MHIIRVALAQTLYLVNLIANLIFHIVIRRNLYVTIHASNLHLTNLIAIHTQDMRYTRSCR